jgi:hypothetical protein
LPPSSGDAAVLGHHKTAIIRLGLWRPIFIPRGFR